MITFNELQQVGSVQEKQDRSEDRALWYSIDNCRWRRTGRRSADVLNSERYEQESSRSAGDGIIET